MKEMRIRLHSFQDVHDLSAVAAKMDCDVRITDGSHNVNAKSIMCIFGINLRHTLTLQLDCDEEDFEVFRTLAGRFEADSQ